MTLPASPPRVNAYLAWKTRGRVSPEHAQRSLHLKTDLYEKGALLPLPQTATTLIIPNDKARLAVGFYGLSRAARQRQRDPDEE